MINSCTLLIAHNSQPENLPQPAPAMTDPTTDNSSRFEAELSLLEAMYPQSIRYTSQSRELLFKPPPASSSPSGGELILRLPDTYPESGLPTLISARDGAKNDLRDRTRHMITELDLVEGEEGIDRIVAAFEVLVGEPFSGTSVADEQLEQNSIDDTGTGLSIAGGSQAAQAQKGEGLLAPKTVIIWLHHLLATSKRKLAITPSLTGISPSPSPSPSLSNSMPAIALKSAPSLSGMTKPGHPGIMVFSGASALVDAHVRELKGLNWQAFQVRYDSTEDSDGSDGVRSLWKFSHEEENATTGKIIEVETMAELVKGIVDERDRTVFLRAVGVK